MSPSHKPSSPHKTSLRYHHRAAGRYQLSLWLLGLGLFALLLSVLRLFLPSSSVGLGSWKIYGLMMLAWALLSALCLRLWGRTWAQQQALHWLDKTIGLSYRSALEYQTSDKKLLEPGIANALERRASIKVKRLALPQPRAWWLPVWIIALLLLLVPHISLARGGIASNNSLTRPTSRYANPPRNVTEETDNSKRDDLQTASSSQSEQATLEDFLEDIPERSADASNEQNDETRDSFANAQKDNANDNQENTPRPNAGMNPFAPVESLESSAQQDTETTNQADSNANASANGSSGEASDENQRDDTVANNSGEDSSSNNDIVALPSYEEAQHDAEDQRQAARDIPTNNELNTPNPESSATDAPTRELPTASGENNNQADSQPETQNDNVAKGENENSQAEASSDGTSAGTQQMASEEQALTGEEQQGDSVTDVAGISNDTRAGDGSTGATVTARERLGGASGEAELLEASQDTGTRVAIGSAEGEQVLRLDEVNQQLNSLPSFDDVAERVVNEGSIPNEYHEVLRRYFR